jgi:hypothetical protein
MLGGKVGKGEKLQELKQEIAKEENREARAWLVLILQYTEIIECF